MAAPRPPRTGPSVPSPPTARVLGVIELLAARPEQEHTLSEIAAQLHMSRATCHTVVRTLLDAGYLLRPPRARGYLLGPSVIAAGRAAQLAFPALALAAEAVRSLAARHRSECVASVIDGDRITVLEWAGPDRVGEARPWSRVGQRVPFAPPFGAAQAAWMEPEAVEAWIDRAPHPEDAPALRRALADVRSCGYDVQRDSDAVARFRDALEDLDRDAFPEDVRAAIDVLAATVGRPDPLPPDLGAGSTVVVNAISAPVFDPSGHPALTLSLHLGRSLSGRRVGAVGRHLVAEADAVTAASGGTRPSAWPVDRLTG